MSALQTATDHLTLGAYAAVGALDTTAQAARKNARELVERRDDLPKEMSDRFDSIVKDVRGQITETVEELRARVEAQRAEARKRLESYATHGEVVVKNLRGGADEAFDRAATLTKEAKTEATTTATTRAKAAKTAAKSPRTTVLNSKTKAELLDMASAKDVSGRSSMTKAQLVNALSA